MSRWLRWLNEYWKKNYYYYYDQEEDDGDGDNNRGDDKFIEIIGQFGSYFIPL